MENEFFVGGVIVLREKRFVFVYHVFGVRVRACVCLSVYVFFFLHWHRPR